MKAILKIGATVLMAATTVCLPYGDSSFDWEPDPFYLLFFFRSYDPVTETTTALFDRRDGTVEIRKFRGSYTYYRALVKRCRQGHAYDSASNSCLPPAHDAIDAYQYCASNNNACNDSDGKLNGASDSGAYTACASDTTRSLQWRVTSRRVLLDIMQHQDRDTVFPDLGEDWLWANESNSTTTASVYRKLDLTEERTKSSYHGVLCQHSGTFL